MVPALEAQVLTTRPPENPQLMVCFFNHFFGPVFSFRKDGYFFNVYFIFKILFLYLKTSQLNQKDCQQK